MIALIIITWQARRLVSALRWRRQGQDIGTCPRSRALWDQILHLFPGDFSTATSFITETGPLIPCDTLCKPVSLQPERLEALCAASRPAGQQDLCLLRNQGSGINRPVLSPSPQWCAGQLVHCLHNRAGELDLFLLAGATASCDRVEKYVCVCVFFSGY